MEEYKGSMAVLATTSLTIGKALVEAGILPPECTRIVIDININDVVKVYYQTNGTEKLLDVVMLAITEQASGDLCPGINEH